MEKTGSKLINLPDTELVKMALEQDQGAFIVLYTRYHTGVRNHIAKYIAQKEDIEDITLESFQKAFSQIASYNPEYKFSTWLYRIALNECLSFLNRQRAQDNISIDEADSNFINTLEGDSYFDGDETQLMFQKAIRSLPEKQRIIFNLRYFQEMKYEDISEIVGTTVGALKASYHHAVKKIEEYFNQND